MSLIICLYQKGRRVELSYYLRVDILDWHAIPEHMRQTVAQGYAVLSPTP